MKEIPLTQGKATLVDDKDYEWLNQYKWCAHNRHGLCYVVRSLNPGTVQMHQLILTPPLGYQCDHIDGNGLNNQRANLRICTNTQNSHNRIVQKGGSSRFKGVCYYKSTGKWRPRIHTNGKHISLGLFTTEIEAAQAYDEAALEYFGEYARLNFN